MNILRRHVVISLTFRLQTRIRNVRMTFVIIRTNGDPTTRSLSDMQKVSFSFDAALRRSYAPAFGTGP